MHHADRSRAILLVEANHSLRRMIALGLRYRGLDVIEASSPDDLLDLKRCPDLILLDIDGEVGNRAVALAEVQANPILTFLPIVMLTWDTSNLSEPDEDHENAKETPARQSRHTTLAKPFDARSLYAVIETQLHQNYWLPAVEEQYAQSDSHVISRISYTPPASPAAPSLCPMLTAAGLMLAFIGLMLQLAITAVGLLIVIAALLWWTLGTKPESLVVARS